MRMKCFGGSYDGCFIYPVDAPVGEIVRLTKSDRKLSDVDIGVTDVANELTYEYEYYKVDVICSADLRIKFLRHIDLSIEELLTELFAS